MTKYLLKKYHKIIPIFSVLIIIISTVSYVCWFWLKLHYQISDDPDDWAKLGDFFGGITNSIFTFLTLMTVVITLYYQRRELTFTRRELQASRRVAKMQEEALRSQASSQDKTVFESAFMQMIDIHFKLIESYETGNINGSQNFNNCLSSCVRNLRSGQNTNILNHLDRRMYRHLFHIANIVELIYNNNELKEIERTRYLNILFNILSDDLRSYIPFAINSEYYSEKKEQLTIISNFA